jgi:hypothetical protein
MDNRNYLYKTIEECQEIRSDAIEYHKLKKGIFRGYWKCYYCYNTIHEDRFNGFI